MPEGGEGTAYPPSITPPRPIILDVSPSVTRPVIVLVEDRQETE